MLLAIFTSQVTAQEPTARRTRLHLDKTANQAWTVNAYIEGYYVPGEQGYVDPIFTADHRWLHLEGRYNYEDLRTGSIWLGYNVKFTSADQNLGLTLTPMVGGVFGRTNGVAPGCEASLTYKKLGFWVSNGICLRHKRLIGQFLLQLAASHLHTRRLASRRLRRTTNTGHSKRQ